QSKKIPREKCFQFAHPDKGPITIFTPIEPSLNTEIWGGITELIYEPLAWTGIRPPGTEGVRMGLAKSWNWRNDGKEFVVNLYPQAHFRKGQPVEASDVTYALKKDYEYTNRFSQLFKNLESLEAEDQNTVVFHMKEGSEYSPAARVALSVNVYPKERWSDLFDEYGDNITNFPNLDLDEMNGSGPYKLVANTESQALYEHVDDYWGQSIGRYFPPEYFKDLYVVDEEQEMTLTGEGKSDWNHTIHGPAYEHMKHPETFGAYDMTADTLSGKVWPPNDVGGIILNYDIPEFRQRWLRKALTYVVDNPELAVKSEETAWGGSPTFITLGRAEIIRKYTNEEIVRETFETEVERGDVVVIKQNIQKAIEILKDHCEGSVEEGWTITDPVANPDLKGKKLGPYTISSGTAMSWQNFIKLYSRLVTTELGIELKPTFPEWGQWSSQVTNRTFDLTYQDVVFRGPIDPHQLFDQFLLEPMTGPWSGAQSMYCKYWTENYPATENTVDEIIKLRDELWSVPYGSEESIEIAHKIQEIYVPQLVEIPCFQWIGGHYWYRGVWANWPTKQDPKWYDGEHRFFHHLYPKTVRTEEFELTPGTVEAGEPATAKITLRNTADVDYNYVVKIRKGPAKAGPGPNVIVHKGLIKVPANGTKTVEMEVSLDTPGSYTLTVDDWRIDRWDVGNPIEKTLIVEKAGEAMISPTDLTLSKAEVEPGESTTISVDVSNDGDAEGSETIEITLGGET
ncbi:hypothetical protein AKJ65_08130, partial [candidate division MSBL1 archaeon SCGC-AAA259E19]